MATARTEFLIKNISSPSMFGVHFGRGAKDDNTTDSMPGEQLTLDARALAPLVTSLEVRKTSCESVVAKRRRGAALQRLLPKPTNRLAGQVHPNALHVGVHLQRVLAHLPAVA